MGETTVDMANTANLGHEALDLADIRTRTSLTVLCYLSLQGTSSGLLAPTVAMQTTICTGPSACTPRLAATCIPQSTRSLHHCQILSSVDQTPRWTFKRAFQGARSMRLLQCKCCH